MQVSNGLVMCVGCRQAFYSASAILRACSHVNESWLEILHENLVNLDYVLGEPYGRCHGCEAPVCLFPRVVASSTVCAFQMVTPDQCPIHPLGLEDMRRELENFLSICVSHRCSCFPHVRHWSSFW